MQNDQTFLLISEIFRNFAHEMIKRFYILAMLVGVSLMATAQLKSENAVYDLGEIGWHIPMTIEIPLQNKARHAVVLHDVRSDCGCTTALWQQGQLLESGQKTTVKVTYDAGLLGSFSKQLIVTIRDGQELKHTNVRIKGKVLASIVDYSQEFPCYLGEGIYITDNVIEFDDVQAGQFISQKLRVVNGTKYNYTPTIMHQPIWLKAVCQPEVLRPGKSGWITFIVDGSQIRNYGLTQTSVYLSRFLGDKVKKENELQVSVTMVPHVNTSLSDYSSAPHAEVDSVVYLKTTGWKLAKRSSGLITIHNSGKSTLEINRLQVYNLGLQVSVGSTSIKPGESTTLKVRGWAENKVSQYKGRKRILLITNDPQRPKITIDVK